MTKDKHYWFAFYPAVWLQDPELCRCSPSARGVWIDLLCFMHESEERGVLVTAGVAWSDKDAACAVRGNQDVCLSGIVELTRCGVLRRRGSDGALYCARMVRERACSDTKKEAGRQGGLAKAKQTSSKHPSTPLVLSSNFDSDSDKKKKERNLQRERARELYDLYPRHVGRKAALIAIAVALSKVDFDTLKAAVICYANDPDVKQYLSQGEKRFVKLPTTWFRGEHWTDAVVESPAKKRESKRAHMDACFDRVAAMKQSDVEAVIVKLRAAKPAAWGCDYWDTQVPSDDGKRLCVRICEVIDAASKRDGC